MFFFASQFNHAELKTLSGYGLGVINFVAIDPEQGKIVGFVFQKGTFAKKTYVVSPRSVLEAGEGVVIVRSNDDVDRIEEIIRAQKAWQENLNFFDMLAITESGSTLGRLKDMLVDQESFYLHRFYVQDGSRERILPRNLLIKVENKKLIFQDEALNKPALQKFESLNPKAKAAIT